METKSPFIHDDDFFKSTLVAGNGTLMKAKGKCGGNPVGMQTGPQDGSGPGAKDKKKKKERMKDGEIEDSDRSEKQQDLQGSDEIPKKKPEVKLKDV